MHTYSDLSYLISKISYIISINFTTQEFKNFIDFITPNTQINSLRIQSATYEIDTKKLYSTIKRFVDEIFRESDTGCREVSDYILIELHIENEHKLIYVEKFVGNLHQSLCLNNNILTWISDDNTTKNNNIYTAIVNMHNLYDSDVINFYITLVHIICENTKFKIFGGFLRDLFLGIVPKDLDFVIEPVKGTDYKKHEYSYTQTAYCFYAKTIKKILNYLNDKGYKLNKIAKCREGSFNFSEVYSVSKNDIVTNIDFIFINKKGDTPSDYCCNLLLSDNHEIKTRISPSLYNIVSIFSDINAKIIRPTYHYDNVLHNRKCELVHENGLKIFNRSLKMIERGWNLQKSCDEQSKNTTYEFIKSGLECRPFIGYRNRMYNFFRLKKRETKTMNFLVSILATWRSQYYADLPGLPYEIIEKIILQYFLGLNFDQYSHIKNPLLLLDTFKVSY